MLNQALKKRTGYDQFNNPYSVTHEGLYFSTSLSANGDSTLFYRFNTSVLKESTCMKYPGTPNASANVYLGDVYTGLYLFC